MDPPTSWSVVGCMKKICLGVAGWSGEEMHLKTKNTKREEQRLWDKFKTQQTQQIF